MDIEAIVNKHARLAEGMRYWDAELLLRSALTELSMSVVSKEDFDSALAYIEFVVEQRKKLRSDLAEAAATHASELRDYEATVQNLEERIRQLESERVPEAAIKLLDDVIFAMTEGFVRCDNCGEQQDTKDLDFMSELTELRAMLASAPQQKKEGE